MKPSRSLRSLVLATGIVLFAVAVAVPYFPRGTDLYVHVLWPWQVMRCLHTGSLPLWLPDLNAGFGSPGIGLYSPLGPSICGALGLILGTGGRGVRAALVLAALAVVAVAPGASLRTRLMRAGLVLLAPAMLTEFFGRFPVSQLLAVPLAWLLLEIAVARRWRWDRDGILFALLWLMHAPTAMMVALLSGVAALVVRPAANSGSPTLGSDGLGGRLVGAWQLAAAGLMAAVLSAWHWWPLLSAVPDFPFRSALTGGEHHPLRNLIGVPGPHLPEINIAMGWAALGLVAALALSGTWKSARGSLAVVAIVLASNLSAPLWRVVTPLAWLQFPWRWMLPATLLATTAVLADAPRVGRFRLALATAALVVPLIGVPVPRLVADPGLRVGTDPMLAGERVMASFSGNPLLIDVQEHRPAWWQDLGPTMALLGPRQAALVPEGGRVRVTAWRPLRRTVEVDSRQQTTLVLRLLADRHWRVAVNDRSVASARWGAALAVSVAPGQSVVEILWATDPLVLGGAIAAAILVLGMVVFSRVSKSTRQRSTDHP